MNNIYFALYTAYLVSLSFCLKENKNQLEQDEEERLEFCNFGLCDIVKLGDSICNTECLTADCNYDLGDCCVNIEGCAKPLISNRVCEEGCKVSECAFDWDDCLDEEDIDISLFPFCAFQFTLEDDFQCTFEILANGVCDVEEICNQNICNFDAFDCEGETNNNCNEGLCPLSSLGDGQCDPECLTSDCNYDLGDCCIGISGCTKLAIDNDNCEPGCLNPECAFDWDDCLPDTSLSDIPFCAFERTCDFRELANGNCDEKCEVPACNHDFRDCDSLPLGATIAIAFGSICTVICTCLGVLAAAG